MNHLISQIPKSTFRQAGLWFVFLVRLSEVWSLQIVSRRFNPFLFIVLWVGNHPWSGLPFLYGDIVKKLKMNQIIKFNYIDDFTGREGRVIGKVVGDYKKVRERWPIEMAEADENMYLVFSCQPRGLQRGYYAVSADEILEN